MEAAYTKEDAKAFGESWIKNLDRLNGKNILILDLETTGLPNTKRFPCGTG